MSTTTLHPRPRPWGLRLPRLLNASWAAPAFTTAGVALWVLLAGATSLGQFADNVEQFVWASSLETSYWKHPPLPSWLLWAVIRLFGFWTGWTYVLSAACFCGAAFFMWRIAHRIAGARVAAVAVLLQGLHLGFSQRAELYNHNTVLLLFSAATVWAVLRALEQHRLTAWLLAGAAAGLALLAKYQAVVILSGIFIALAMAGEMKDRRVRCGCAWAMVAALLVLAPHLAGLLGRPHSPLGYALSRMHLESWTALLSSSAAYLVSQLRFHLPMLAAIALVALTAGVRPARAAPVTGGSMPPIKRRAWLVGLVLWPLLFVTLTPLWSGMPLQAQWGLPALQFFVIVLALKVAQAWPQLSTAALGRAVVCVQLLSAIVFVGSPLPPDRRVDTAYPAQDLANTVLRDWQASTNCPLRFVVGPSFEAGLVSMYSGTYAKVLEDGDYAKSPWIDAREMQWDGFVVMQHRGGPLPEESRPVKTGARQWPDQLAWVIVPPQRHCP